VEIDLPKGGAAMAEIHGNMKVEKIGYDTHIILNHSSNIYREYKGLGARHMPGYLWQYHSNILPTKHTLTRV
jgi:gentisate 1,2-dioxygenase